MILPTGEYVVVNHWRRAKYASKKLYIIGKSSLADAHARGGYTEALVFDKKDGEVIAMGESHCNLLDTYNKKLGREIALGRALKALAHGVMSIDLIPPKGENEEENEDQQSHLDVQRMISEVAVSLPKMKKGKKK